MDKYGYIRVSSKDQNPERQMMALIENGINKKNIYTDVISGKNFNRPSYRKLIKKIKKGDLIVIKSIDRLGRNYNEILEQWRIITKEKEANINVLDMPLLNTDGAQEDLTGAFISDLVLQILAYVAETERAFIKQRQAEGIAIAKDKGIVFGRPRKEIPIGFEHSYYMWKEGMISKREAARRANMSYTTFYRRCSDMQRMT